MSRSEAQDAALPTFSPRRPRLLRLPRELRNCIWSFSLIEPPKWTKRHNAFCRFCDRTGSIVEPPPASLLSDPYRSSAIHQVPLCSCAHRSGLGLLLVNRQIHVEAAPIFWSRNVHCFDDVRLLSRGIDSTLRKVCCDYIYHISFMVAKKHVEGDWSGLFLRKTRPKNSENDLLWETIFKCKNLRSLQLRPEQAYHYGTEFGRLQKSLPHFETFELTHLQIYSFAPAASTSSSSDRLPEIPRIYYKLSQKLSLDLGPNELKNAVQDFMTNFCVHVDFEVWTKFLGFTSPIPPRFADSPASSLKDNNSKQTLTLRDGTITTVWFYGLPNGPATRIRHARERQAHEARLKAANLPSTREMKQLQFLKEKQKAKMELQEVEDRRVWDKVQAEKEQSLLKQENAEARRAKEKLVLLQRRAEKSEDSKREERKRVQKNGK